MAIIYNVTIKIESSIHEEWLAWMKEIHIPDVMKTGYFTSWKLTRILEDPDEHGVGYAIQYQALGMEDFISYQKKDAQRLQKEHAERYGQRYVAFRTVLEIIDEGQS